MKWIDVKEKIPPRGEGILVTNGKITTCTQLDDWTHGTCLTGFGFGGYEWEFYIDYKDITHWAKLPELPKIKEF